MRNTSRWKRNWRLFVGNPQKRRKYLKTRKARKDRRKARVELRVKGEVTPALKSDCREND